MIELFLAYQRTKFPSIPERCIFFSFISGRLLRKKKNVVHCHYNGSKRSLLPFVCKHLTFLVPIGSLAISHYFFGQCFDQNMVASLFYLCHTRRCACSSAGCSEPGTAVASIILAGTYGTYWRGLYQFISHSRVTISHRPCLRWARGINATASSQCCCTWEASKQPMSSASTMLWLLATQGRSTSYIAFCR